MEVHCLNCYWQKNQRNGLGLPIKVTRGRKKTFFYRAPNQLHSLFNIHADLKTMKERLTLFEQELLRNSVQQTSSFYVAYFLWIGTCIVTKTFNRTQTMNEKAPDIETTLPQKHRKFFGFGVTVF